MEEVYKKCIEDYEVSNVGNIRKLLKNGSYKIINCSIQNGGYKYFQLNRNNKRCNYLIHHLVAEHFIGIRPDGLVIDHIDRNKLNNNKENLRYISQLENMRNTDKYISEFPPDTENRKEKISKKYRDENRDDILKKHKEYYIKNKEKMLEYSKNKKIDIECSKCKIIRTTSYNNYNHLKRNGIDNNLCKRCSSIKNLPN
jgi:hypothetical protein